LFAPGTLPDLENEKLANRALMEAVYRLAWLKDESGLVPVNWRDMETEELGSVYESLLELTPQLNGGGRQFKFAGGGEAKGHARKTTGSYYTPDSLVQALLDSALGPVLDRAEAEADDPAAALLSVTVLDPACGSGHFLLAAARRIATRLAQARAQGLPSPAGYRHALRDVARACIHGVDRNPMAVELTKVALWIETVEPGKPLGFLDANIRCGDSLLGVFDLKALEQGIPDAAYKPLSGDDKEAARIAGRENRAHRDEKKQHELALAKGAAEFAGEAHAIAAMPEDDVAGVAARASAYEQLRKRPGWWALKTACDLYVAAFLAPKHFRKGAMAQAKTPDLVPTTRDLRAALSGHTTDHQLVAKAVDLASAARAFHWPLEFPDVMAADGFDVVLVNPPWERIKLQEQEFFASRDPEIATAPNAAARGKKIAALKEAAPASRERSLYEEFEAAKRAAEASSVFARVEAEDGGRFPLTGRGDVNTYALFAELFASLTSKRGRAGVIVPTGIATDATTAPFFAALVDGKRLAQLIDFENRERLFPAVDSRMKFCLLTIGHDEKQSSFAFFLTDPRQLASPERRFTLSPEDIARINPNTKTAPVFRSRADAELTAKIYARVPVLIDESKGKDGNPWGVDFRQGLFNMTSDSGLFRTAAELEEAGFMREGSDWVAPEGAAPRQRPLALAGGRDGRSLALEGGAMARAPERYVPLFEAKMIHQFDHRWATYAGGGRNGQDDDSDGGNASGSRDATLAEKRDPAFESAPRYWVPGREVAGRLAAKGWTRSWLMGWRDIARATDERTVIAAAFPRAGVGNKIPLMFPNQSISPRQSAALVGCLSSLALDFCARQKIGGTTLNFFIFFQFPVLPPSTFTESDLAFIVPRVLELTYTSHAMAPFARDLWRDSAIGNRQSMIENWVASHGGGDQVLSRLARLADGDGTGEGGLPLDAKLAEGRAVRSDAAGAPGGGFDPGQRRGGLRPPEPGVLRSVPPGGAGLAQGIGDAPDPRAGDRPHEGAGNCAAAPADGGHRQNALRLDPETLSRLTNAEFRLPPYRWDEDRRAILRAELDAFYARAYGLTRDELRYILDPADVKGADYPSETFRVLKQNEIRRYGEYRTARLVLAAWDKMERGEIPEIAPPIAVAAPAMAPGIASIDTKGLPDRAWAAPAGGDVRDKTLAQIAAVLKALPGPTAIALARRAALYALEPRLLTARLQGADRVEWLRVVGTEANLRVGVTTFGLGGATGWGEAVRLLASTGCLVEDAAAQTWAPGTGLDAYFTESWPRRAGFALQQAARIMADESAAAPTAEEEEGLRALAA